MHCTYSTRLTLDTVVALRFASRLQALRKTKTMASVSTLGLLGRRLDKQSFKSAKHRAVPTCYIILHMLAKYSKVMPRRLCKKSNSERQGQQQRTPYNNCNLCISFFTLAACIIRIAKGQPPWVLRLRTWNHILCTSNGTACPCASHRRGSSFGELWPLGLFSCWVHTPGSRLYVFWKAWKDWIRG